MAQKINVKQQSGIAFKAGRVTNLSSGTNSDINFICDGKFYDTASAYSTSTGLFTAPIDGIYVFSASAFVETTATSRSFFSGRGTYSTGTLNGLPRNIERSLDNTTVTNRAKGYWELYMNKGETFGLNLWTSASNQINSPDTTFTGHLIMAITLT